MVALAAITNMEALSNMAPVNLHFNSLPLNRSYDPLRREILCQIDLRQQKMPVTMYISSLLCVNVRRRGGGNMKLGARSPTVWSQFEADLQFPSSRKPMSSSPLCLSTLLRKHFWWNLLVTSFWQQNFSLSIELREYVTGCFLRAITI